MYLIEIGKINISATLNFVNGHPWWRGLRVCGIYPKFFVRSNRMTRTYYLRAKIEVSSLKSSSIQLVHCGELYYVPLIHIRMSAPQKEVSNYPSLFFSTLPSATWNRLHFTFCRILRDISCIILFVFTNANGNIWCLPFRYGEMCLSYNTIKRVRYFNFHLADLHWQMISLQ